MAWSKSEQSRVLKSSSDFGDGSVYRDKCIPLRLLPNRPAAHPSGVPKTLIALGSIPQNSTDGPFWGTNETHITTHAVSDLLSAWAVKSQAEKRVGVAKKVAEARCS